MELRLGISEAVIVVALHMVTDFDNESLAVELVRPAFASSLVGLQRVTYTVRLVDYLTSE